MERPSSTERGFKFEPFELNLQTRELRKFDVRIRLADQPFQILTMLLERPGEIVTREDLQKGLWPDGTFVDFELSLNAAIKKLRQALGDSADEPRFIETFPRRGYRFIAPIEEIIPATSVATPEKRPSRGVIVGIVALILIAVLLFALYRVRIQDKAFVAFQEMKITRVTTTGKTVSAAISPDAKYVAHVMSGPDGQSVWLRHMASGSDVQILPAIKVEYGNLNFSADGNSIYYGRGEQEGFPGKGSIYETALFGGVTHRIITDADAGPHQFSFSPDGKRLAFIRSDQKQGNAVMIANSDGTGARKLAERTGDNFFSPVAWSPDGKVVACGDYNASRHKASVILIPAQGGPEKVLATGPWAIVVALEWLPTGRGLLAAGGAQENCCWQLWDISYPTGEVHRLTNDLDSYTGISLSADAQTLVSIQIHGVSNVWVASDPKLERAQQITFSDGWNAGIYWTPEGKIAYNSNATGAFNIWITTPDGSNPKQLTDDRTFCTSPRVTADGRYIVFLSGRSGMSHVWRMDIDGSNPIELTKGNHQRFVDIAPDGKWVLYSSIMNIWKAPIDGGPPVRVTDRSSEEPIVSPDQKWILFSYWGEPERPTSGIAIIPFEGGAPVKRFEISNAHWGADASTIQYVSRHNDIDNIWEQPVAGGPARQVTHFDTGQIFSWRFSRIGSN